jgi:hypothetical protein
MTIKEAGDISIMAVRAGALEVSRVSAARLAKRLKSTYEYRRRGPQTPG